MVRKLPPRDDPEKRRRQIFKRVYQHLEHWQALREDRGMSDVITTEDGEDIFIGDLMIGFPTLPPRQQQAFERICLKGYTETACRDELLPNSISSTPVQQYADSGLVRMIAAYDLKQIGQWPPPEPVKKSKPKYKRRTPPMPVAITSATLHPLVRKGLETTLQEIHDEIESLKTAAVQVETMLGITGMYTLAAHKGQDSDSVKKPATAAQPAPNPTPVGKPKLEDMARELASVGTGE